MFYKNIILDLDDTLYNYKICHQKSLDKVFESIIKINSKLNLEELKNKYKNIDSIHKIQTSNKSTSHNKFIKIKYLLENYKISLNNLEVIHNLYWECFFSQMKPYDGVLNFIKWNNTIGIKIGILTDYQTDFQLKKLKFLKILDYVDCVVTSEEVGCEKPNNSIFNFIINKMNINCNETILIGDNFNKDIQGAINNNIYSYWFHKIFLIKSDYTEFDNFNNLTNYFKKIYNELNNLKNISKLCGERLDLTQAGGGNTSVKYNNLMFVKASGYSLSDISINDGYVVIDNKKLIDDIENLNTKTIINYNLLGKLRSSIETYMHAILNKYVVHLHPISVNRILVSKNAKNIISSLFPKALILDYYTPGIELCNEIKKYYNGEEVIFLLNHGLIVTNNNYNLLENIINDVCSKCEEYCNLDLSIYKKTNIITSYILNNFNIDIITYLSQDSVITNYLIKKRELFEYEITFPDFLIYCGIKIVFCDTLSKINNYYIQYKELPKIIIINNNIYIICNSLKKAKDIESVLKANLIILDSNYEKTYLSEKEICFLNSWDAEKYRKYLNI